MGHLPLLNDQLEGALTDRSRNRLISHFIGLGQDIHQASAQVEQYEAHRAEFYVSSWHMNSSESYLMWKVYAGRGFAVQTTFERLALSLDAHPEDVHGTVVEYRDFRREEIPVGNIFTPVSTKDSPYRDEREFRLLLWRPDPYGRPVTGPPGFAVKIAVAALLERIFVSPEYTGDLSVLKNALAAKSVDCEVVTSAVRE